MASVCLQTPVLIPTAHTLTSPAPMGAVSQLPGFVTETMIVEMDLMNLTVLTWNVRRATSSVNPEPVSLIAGAVTMTTTVTTGVMKKTVSMPSVPVHSSPAITNDVYPETGPAIMTMIAMTTVMKRIVITMKPVVQRNSTALSISQSVSP